MENEHLVAAVESLRAELMTQEQIVDKARKKVSVAQTELSQAAKKADEIKTAIETVESLITPSAPKLETIPDYVLAALERSGTKLHDEEILRSMRELGWTTDSADPRNLVRSVLSRMVKGEAVERVGPGTYDLPHRVPGSSWHFTEDDDGGVP